MRTEERERESKCDKFEKQNDESIIDVRSC